MSSLKAISANVHKKLLQDQKPLPYETTFLLKNIHL